MHSLLELFQITILSIGQIYVKAIDGQGRSCLLLLRILRYSITPYTVKVGLTLIIMICCEDDLALHPVGLNSIESEIHPH